MSLPFCCRRLRSLASQLWQADANSVEDLIVDDVHDDCTACRSM